MARHLPCVAQSTPQSTPRELPHALLADLPQGPYSPHLHGPAVVLGGKGGGAPEKRGIPAALAENDVLYFVRALARFKLPGFEELQPPPPPVGGGDRILCGHWSSCTETCVKSLRLILSGTHP